MDVVCPLCAGTGSLPEEVLARGGARCGRCGAKLSLRDSVSGAHPRDQLDTIPLDSGSLRKLTSISASDDDVDALLAAPKPDSAVVPESVTRAPQMTVPFELKVPSAAAEAPRAPQTSVAFELTKENPVLELQREAPVPLARPPLPSVAFELNRPGRTGVGWLIALVLLLVVAATLLFGRV
jgi:hypothetical protein